MMKTIQIFFTISLISINLDILCMQNDFQINPEIHMSYNEAKRILSSILPDTLLMKRSKKQYKLLQELDGKIYSLINYKLYQKSMDPRFKELVEECKLTNQAAQLCCESFYEKIPNLYNPKNKQIDGNDFNIMNTYKAYKICIQKILNALSH